MKSLILSVILALSAVPALAQGSVKGDAVINGQGAPIPFPTIRVCTPTATTGGNPNTPCAPLDNVFTDATLTTTAPNPFVGDQQGNFQFYAAPGFHQVQVCSAGLSCTMYPTILAPDPNNFGSLFGAAVISNCGGNTANCTPALSGMIRLGPGDAVCWRNAANTADVCLTKNASDQIVGSSGSGSGVATQVLSPNTNPAQSGIIRLSAFDTACWRAASGVTDVCLSHDGADHILTNGSGFIAPQFISSSNNPAQSGIVRLAAGDSACWRNTANTADVCITQVAGSLVGISAGATTQLVSPNTPHAATGVFQLAASDTGCWRNAANTADICISKDSNDNISVSSLSLNFLQSLSALPALSGVVRLASGDKYCWRNNANTADVCISKNSSDQIIIGSASSSLLVTALDSASANIAASGFISMAAGDKMCFRNQANTADICITKAASDAISVPTLSVPGTISTAGPLTFTGDTITGQTQTDRMTLSWPQTGGSCNSAGLGPMIEVLPPGPNGITVRQLDWYDTTAPSSESTLMQVAINDPDASTNFCTTSLGNGVAFVSTTCTGNIPAGHHLTIKTITNRVGGSDAQGCVWTVWYTMN